MHFHPGDASRGAGVRGRGSVGRLLELGGGFLDLAHGAERVRARASTRLSHFAQLVRDLRQRFDERRRIIAESVARVEE